MHIDRRNAIRLRDIIRSAVIQIVVMLSVMLSVVMLSDIMLSFIMLSVIVLSVILLSVIMLLYTNCHMKSAVMHIDRRNAITLSVVMLSVVAPLVPSRNEIESLPFFQPNLAKIVRLIT